MRNGWGGVDLLFLGYDPGGKGTHGVAAIRVSKDGTLVERPECAVVENAEMAWRWLSSHSGAAALGIDTLLAWSPFGGRACDNALRKAYRQFGPTVIPQNALYSSMTLNGAIVAKRAERVGIPLVECHPKLLVKISDVRSINMEQMIASYREILGSAHTTPKKAKQADDMADALVAAWCAYQGFSELLPENRTVT